MLDSFLTNGEEAAYKTLIKIMIKSLDEFV